VHDSGANQVLIGVTWRQRNNETFVFEGPYLFNHLSQPRFHGEQPTESPNHNDVAIERFVRT
jgi:hypothetical protein